eukprot:m.65128 g.65128  ORF g.65128 m.65128 type:complete len:314 (-) comp23524_c0_seq1:64-1005(-)
MDPLSGANELADCSDTDGGVDELLLPTSHDRASIRKRDRTPHAEPPLIVSNVTKAYSRKHKAICGVVTVVLVVLFVMLLHSGWLQPVFLDLLKFVRGLGPWGPLVLLLLIAVLVPLCVPTTPLNIGAGFLFGWGGLPVITGGALIGASVAFFISRKFYAEAAERRLANVKIYRTLNLLFMQDQGKFSWNSTWIVFLTRASPLFPFPLINYANGLTRVAFSSYLLATLIGMLPWQIVDIYLGDEIKNIAEIGTPHSGKYLIGVLIFTVVMTAFVTVYARRLLKRMETQAKQRQQEDEASSDDSYDVQREAEDSV